jgi:5'(3')-deoxyribonucleotidase
MIYFDLDGVLADMESGLMQNAEVKSLRVIVDDLISSKFTDYKGLVDDDIKTKFKSELESNPESEVKELKKAFSKYTSKVFSVASKPGFYRNLPLMPGSVEMVKKAGELSGELPNILSAPVGDENDLNNPSVIEKKEWVAEHFGELVNEVIITIDKGKVVKSKDDILIDDRPKYVEKFESAGGTAILYKDSVQATAELVKLIESKPSVVEKVSNKRWVKTFESFRKNLLLNRINENLTAQGKEMILNIFVPVSVVVDLVDGVVTNVDGDEIEREGIYSFSEKDFEKDFEPFKKAGVKVSYTPWTSEDGEDYEGSYSIDVPSLNDAIKNKRITIIVDPEDPEEYLEIKK